MVRTLSVRHPRTRALLGAAFLAGNVALTLPLALFAAGWYWPGFEEWFQHLNLDSEQSAANWYSSGLWAAASILAAAQLLRPPPILRGPRLLWMLGWILVALFAALIALEEVVSVKDTLERRKEPEALLAQLNLAGLPTGMRWAAIVMVVAAPVAVLSGWAIYTSLRQKPALLLLTALALVLGIAAILRDGFGVLYGTTHWWGTFLDDSSEIMVGAILAVVFFETLVARHAASVDGWEHRRKRLNGWAALAVTLVVVAASIPALLAEYEWEEAGWMRPLFYAGPITRFEQPFQANLDNLKAIDVWGYAESPDGESGTAAILVSLLPGQGGRPIWTQAEVRGNRSSPAINRIAFEPIPRSEGTRYDLVIFSEPRHRIHLGLTGERAGPHGDVIVNDVPQGRQLAMGTYAIATGGRVVQDLLTRDPRRLFLIGDVIVTVFAWILAVTAAARGLSGPPSRFRHGFLGPTAQISVLIVAGLIAAALIVLPIEFAYTPAPVPGLG